jgi:hypothetical protein
MSAIWSMSKALRIPLDKRLTTLQDVPNSISFVIRKRQQIDNFNDLPREKRPPDDILWDGSPEELEEWFDEVLDRNKTTDNEVVIDMDEVE